MPIDSYPSITDQVARQAYLAKVVYAPGVQVAPQTVSLTPVDIDATNLAITFAAPPSGTVFVELNAYVDIGAVAGHFASWVLREAGSVITGTATVVARHPGGTAVVGTRALARVQITGLVPGSSHTYIWGQYTSIATAVARIVVDNSAFGPATMTVLDAGTNTSGVMSGGIWSGPQVINTGAAAGKGLVIQGAPSQTANLQEWSNSAGVVQASISPAGVITSGNHIAGDIDISTLPRGTISYSQVVGAQTAFTTSVAITGLSVTTPVLAAGRRIRITTFVAYVPSAVGIWANTAIVADGVTAHNVNFPTPVAGAANGIVVAVVLQPSAAAHTYTILGQLVVGSGNLAPFANANAPNFILVEDIGV